jgi:hypothetical protein
MTREQPIRGRSRRPFVNGDARPNEMANPFDELSDGIVQVTTGLAMANAGVLRITQAAREAQRAQQDVWDEVRRLDTRMIEQGQMLQMQQEELRDLRARMAGEHDA